MGMRKEEYEAAAKELTSNRKRKRISTLQEKSDGPFLTRQEEDAKA